MQRYGHVVWVGNGRSMLGGVVPVQLFFGPYVSKFKLPYPQVITVLFLIRNNSNNGTCALATGSVAT